MACTSDRVVLPMAFHQRNFSNLLFMGVFIVETVDDLLLEWLACELVLPNNAGSCTNPKINI